MKKNVILILIYNCHHFFLSENCSELGFHGLAAMLDRQFRVGITERDLTGTESMFLSPPHPSFIFYPGHIFLGLIFSLAPTLCQLFLCLQALPLWPL